MEEWNICVGEEEGGFGCLLKYYKCLNEYMVSSGIIVIKIIL